MRKNKTSATRRIGVLFGHNGSRYREVRSSQILRLLPPITHPPFTLSADDWSTPSGLNAESYPGYTEYRVVVEIRSFLRKFPITCEVSEADYEWLKTA